MHWIKKAFEGADEDLARIRPYLLLLLNNKPSVVPISKWQKGCPEIIPKLRARATWRLRCLVYKEAGGFIS